MKTYRCKREIVRFASAVAGVSLLALAVAHAQTGRDSPSTPQGNSLPPPLQVGGFTSALANGPNGPIPTIVVDQFGYLPQSRKIAVAREPRIGYDAIAPFVPGRALALVDVATGEIVASGRATPWSDGALDPVSGDRAWWFDFSFVSRPGRYVVADPEKRVRSAEFSIAEAVYRPVLVRAVRMFFYQRAGVRKSAEHAGDAWADAASHLGPGQDPASEPWPGTTRTLSQATLRDLRGGWYDAGDYNKYTTWTANNVVVLLRAYEENPHAFGDDTGIPESGNSVPDLLDEVKWALDWLLRMQGQDGGVLCVQSLSSASPPSRSVGRSHYGPPTTSATLLTAAAFATAAKIYAALDQPEMKAYAERLAARAKDAWRWAEANASVLYWNNDEARQPGSRGLAHGQQELSESERVLAKLKAATALFELGDSSLTTFVETLAESMLPRHEPTMWEVDANEALLRVSRLSGVTPSVAERIRTWFLGPGAARASRFAADLQRDDPYRAPIAQYTWGSNKAKAMQARQFQLTALHAADADVRAAAQEAALDYGHYIHGVNPLGLVYLTNMGRDGATHSASTMFHAWFAKGTPWEMVSDGSPGPPPGYLVGGPNPAFRLDDCCSGSRTPGTYACGSARSENLCKQAFRPPLGQPPAKSYLQFNDTWPTNSWEVSEPSTVYQAYYVRLLATFVR